MARYYFENQDSENCYTIDHFYDQLEQEELPQMQIFPAIIMTGEPFFWCDIIQECFEKDDNSCGKLNCKDYKPRNGKNGRCRFHKNCYAPSDISETIYRKPNKQ
jgi:hypothetical protein